jgi:methionine synthase II (cobalamin-independent)
MAPPFRAEQIGSLLRPPELLAARDAASSWTYSQTVPEEVKRLTQEAIAAAVQKQLALSIRPITSGEYERDSFYSGFFEKIQGFDALPAIPIPSGFRTNYGAATLLQRQGVKTRPGVVANRKIEHVQSAYLEEWESLKSLLPPEKWKECKLTMPSPTWQHMQLAKGTAYAPSAYSSDKEYFTDLAAAYATEICTLYDAGLRSIQVDDPALTYFLTPEFRAGCVADEIDPEELLDLYIWAHNACLAGRPSDLHVGIHLCRGNMPGSTHVVAGSYELIAKRLFTELDYDTYYLEYDTERAGDFEPLRHLPVGKNVVLGVVSTKAPELEDMEDLVKKVHAAADVIAKGQDRSREGVIQTSLGVSPQCGFSSRSVAGGKDMTFDRMWEKLVLVKDLARRIWGDTA